MANVKWNLENATVEASKYSRRVDFLKGSPGAYNWAQKNQHLETVCAHMGGNQSHTLESVQAAALKYKTRKQFLDGDIKAYRAAHRNGWLDLVCSHMESVFTYHSLESVKEVALKYDTRKQFENGDKNTYQAAQRNNWLDTVCSHMEKVLTYHTLESVKIAALKYSTRKKFQDGDNYTYHLARKNNWLELCCDHMEQGLGGFDTSKPATLYYIRLDLTNNDSLYKIGITNYPNVQDRIKTMMLYPGTTATILKTIKNDDGAYIAKLEKKLHKHFRNFQYTGQKIMDNGNTELFTVDVRGWGVLN